MMLKSLLLLCMATTSVVVAFSPIPSQKATTSLLQAVKYDPKTEQWATDDPENEGPAAGYGLPGTLLRGGPKPLFSRILTPDTYEQAVLKFMATDKVDRITAQANMDVFLENAQDWAYARLNGYNPDYVTVSEKNVALRAIWASGVFFLLYKGAVSIVTGCNFNESIGL